jgi:hypothetical protein
MKCKQDIDGIPSDTLRNRKGHERREKDMGANSLFKSFNSASVAAFNELATMISSTYMSINIVTLNL